MSTVDVPEGATAYWKVTVTNKGETTLTNVTVNDALVPACDTAGVTLAVGASVSTYCALDNISVAVVNSATASFAGELTPFPSSSAQVMDSPSRKTTASVASIAPIVTTGAVDALVPAASAPTVTG